MPMARTAKNRAGSFLRAACGALLACAIPIDALANTISGTVRYQDKIHSTADGTVTATPMTAARYVTLDFVRASNLVTVLGSTTTDASGNFTSPDVGAHTNIVILVKATGTYENQTVVIRDQSTGGGAIQSFQSAEFDLSGGNLAGQVVDFTADDISGAFNIYDCFIRAHKYVRESFFATPPTVAAFTLTVRWEDGKDSESGAPSTSYFSAAGGQLFMNILGDTSIDSDAFDDSVLTHEYGHLAAHLYSNDDSPGGSHSLGQALDLRLAFSEGWADYFSCAVRGTHWYVDTTAGLPLIFEIDTPAATGAPGLTVTGPENELAVCAVLWDIAGSAITINNGAIDTPLEALWDVMDRYLPTAAAQDVCLEDLWDGFFEDAATPDYGSANRTALNNIFNGHDVRYFVDAFEPNASAGAATPILTDGTSVTCTHYYDANGDGRGEGDEDWFSFNPEAGKTYTIETLNLGNSADTVLQLYDTNATTLLATSDNISAANLASQIVYLFPAAGKYYLRVTRSTGPLPIVDPPPDDPDPPQGTRANYGHYDLRVTEGGTAPPPTVAIISPSNGAVNVGISTRVVATFSHPVQAGTVTTSSFTVSTGGTPVAGTVSLNSSRTVATFRPNTGLLFNTTYTVNLTNAIKDDADQALTPFTSTFTTKEPTVAPPGGLTRVPQAQIASGDGYVEVEWVFPTGAHDGVIVAVGQERFPTIAAVEEDGVVNLVVSHGTEVYRGDAETQARIETANGQRAFVTIWTFAGTDVSEPVYVATRASRGGRGIVKSLNPPGPGPQPGGPTLRRPAKLQVASGDGYADIEWVAATGNFDGVVVAVGSRTFPKLEQVNDNGTLKLVVTRGTEVYRDDGKVRIRLVTANGGKRLCCVWTYKGIEYSRPLCASTRASRGGRGLSKRESFYGDDFEAPDPDEEPEAGG